MRFPYVHVYKDARNKFFLDIFRRFSLNNSNILMCIMKYCLCPWLQYCDIFFQFMLKLCTVMLQEEESSERGPVLSFFETATVEELSSMPGCSKKKAEVILKMRPFQTWETLVRRSVIFTRQDYSGLCIIMIITKNKSPVSSINCFHTYIWTLSKAKYMYSVTLFKGYPPPSPLLL